MGDDMNPTNRLSQTTVAAIATQRQAKLLLAIQQVQRLCANHDALLVALRWCVAHDGECLGDHPEVMANVRDAIARAEGAE
jgi:hypothetical protein